MTNALHHRLLDLGARKGLSREMVDAALEGLGDKALTKLAAKWEIDLEHVPLLLHRDSTHGYTSDPMMAVRSEPEAIDDEASARLVGLNRANFEVVHAEELARREVRSLTAQIKEESARARRQGVDVTPHIEAMRRELDVLRARLADAA